MLAHLIVYEIESYCGTGICNFRQNNDRGSAYLFSVFISSAYTFPVIPINPF